MISPCLTLNILRFASRVKWSNPGKGVAPPTPQCSIYWKGSLLVVLNYGCQLYFSSNGEASVLKIWEMWSTSSLPLLPGLLLQWVVTLDKVISMGEIHLCKKKKNLQKKHHKNIAISNKHDSLNSRHKIAIDTFIYHKNQSYKQPINWERKLYKRLTKSFFQIVNDTNRCLVKVHYGMKP